jgi:hypothetical protein
MLTRVIIIFPEKEYQALLALSEKEFRNPRMQAALIIRRELERLGLVEAANLITGNESPKADKAKKENPTPR